jgi:hypothetical protein
VYLFVPFITITPHPTVRTMASADVQQPPAQEAAPALPDYLTNPDAVLGDKDAKWRYGRAPDYSKTRKVFAESKFLRTVARLHVRRSAVY